MANIQNGQTRFILWGGAEITLASSVFDVGTTTIFQFDSGLVRSFRSGRNPAFNNLDQFQPWYGYQISAIGITITLPDEVYGLGNDPTGSPPTETGSTLPVISYFAGVV